jgi:hypothetical protein
MLAYIMAIITTMITIDIIAIALQRVYLIVALHHIILLVVTIMMLRV